MLNDVIIYYFLIFFIIVHVQIILFKFVSM